jgi:putative transposase
MTDLHSYLKRLPAEHYVGSSYVHWSMTIEDRRAGWLKPIVYYKFRELLTHTMFRYSLCCPIFCCMPDHFHMLWIGLREQSDQRKAMRFFRQRLNEVLQRIGYGLQSQPYDRVLRADEQHQVAFEAAAEYIARNPERSGLVEADQFHEYPYTDCLMPGYPELTWKQADFWPRFWRLESFLRAHWSNAPTADDAGDQ